MKAKTNAIVPIRSATPAILPEIRSLIEASRSHALTTANLALVARNWHIGRLIAEDIQRHAKRADYGEQLLARLAQFLTREYGEGYSHTSLNEMRRFFEIFEILHALPAKSFGGTPPIFSLGPLGRNPGVILHALPAKSSTCRLALASAGKSSERICIRFPEHSFLSWTHYRVFFRIAEPLKRRFYFDQACFNRWSTRELERRIEGALFERVALSRDTRQLAALEKRKGSGEMTHYTQIFKDPYLLDFLGLKGAYSEKDLEAALVHNLEEFLAELGNDFCFIRRQYPMRIDDVDYWLDLLFFHRGLRCLVAIDLKLRPFTAADKGHMDLYLAWLKEHEWRTGENEPVGLILCTSKRQQHVELLLRGNPHKMQVSQYLTQLPARKLLEERLKLYSRILQAH